MRMYLYFESCSHDEIPVWYKRVGETIRACLVNDGYQCQEYRDFDPDFRFYVKYGDALLNIIVVVYRDNPIKGSVTYEGDTIEVLEKELSPKIKTAVSRLKDITDCRWLTKTDFRNVMGWPPLAA